MINPEQISKPTQIKDKTKPNKNHIMHTRVKISKSFKMTSKTKTTNKKITFYTTMQKNKNSLL